MKPSLLLFALPLAVFVVGTARADGGYFSGVKGARASGRAGAFTAKADDLSAVALNPAGLAHIETTTLQVGNRFSYNSSEYSRAPTLDWGNVQNGVPPYAEFSAVQNDQPLQAVDPFIGVATNFGLADWTFALAAYSPAGSARSEFPVDGGQRYMMVRRDVAIINYTASAAWRYRELFGLGASLQWIQVPWLDYEIVIDANQFGRTVNPVSSELDMRARISGSDPFTFNAILGGWVRPLPSLEIGLAAQIIPTAIKTSSHLDIDPVSSSINESATLQRNGTPANDVTLTLPLPLTARVGVRYIGLADGKELFDIELDVTYETWSRVERFTLDGDGLVATLQNVDLDVGVIEIEKQWQDTASVSLGGDYVVVPETVTLRAGTFYTSAVAKPSYANVDFASGQHVGGALGASLQIQNLELALAYEYRRQLSMDVSEGDARVYQEVPASPCEAPYTDPTTCNEQFLGQRSPAVNAGRYDAQSHVVSLDALYRF